MHGVPLVPRSVLILPKFKSGNGAVMHLVRAVGEAERADAGIGLGEPRIIRDAAPARITSPIATGRMYDLPSFIQPRIAGSSER